MIPMAISLNKGERLSLSKEAPNLKKVLVGLGWDARATEEEEKEGKKEEREEMRKGGRMPLYGEGEARKEHRQHVAQIE